MARGGGHHSHHSSHHSHHSHHHHHYRRSAYGGGSIGKTDEERRQERKRAIIIVGIYFFIILWVDFGLPFAKIFSLPRSPLPASAVDKTAYYTDDYGYVKDAGVLTEGMEYFYEKTGVQPYVYYTDAASFFGEYYTISGMDSLYDSLFTDEGHFLLIITGEIAGYTSHNVSFYYGADVDQVMDAAAINLFFENFDKEALKQTSADAVISNAFRKTAGDLRGIRAYGVGYIILLVLVLAAIIGCIMVLIRKERQRKMDEIIKNSRDHDQILYDDMPEELHAPERMTKDAVKQAEILAEKKKEGEERGVWGPTISWDDALKDIQESEAAEENTQSIQNDTDVSIPRDGSDIAPIRLEAAEQSDIGDIGRTASEDRAATLFEEKRISTPEEKHTNTERQNDTGYIPSVDWGFSMDKGIDLFADEEKNDKK